MSSSREQTVRISHRAGLLQKLTTMVLESALEGEMSDHLGYAAGDPAGGNGGNSRNGHRPKTVITEIGPVDIDVPRDRQSTFQPKIVRTRQRRLTGIEDLVISLSAKGLTAGEVQAHLRRSMAPRCPARRSPRSPTQGPSALGNRWKKASTPSTSPSTTAYQHSQNRTNHTSCTVNLTDPAQHIFIFRMRSPATIQLSSDWTIQTRRAFLSVSPPHSQTT
jgi:hypothetical protein